MWEGGQQLEKEPDDDGEREIGKGARVDIVHDEDRSEPGSMRVEFVLVEGGGGGGW